MPSNDHNDNDRDRHRDRDFERGDRSEKSGSKQKSSNSKSKDLSHVPCKFFKVGGCTAGSSCPFSHHLSEPGQKETCAWFVKGNCKFGHKCALAHILPGQDMSMDRKNKKAAQQAAAAAGGNDKTSKGKGGRRDGGGSGAGNQGKNALLAGGSTAPTRILNSGPSGASSTGRPPMNLALKASISPSAPAPPLKDSDFASFTALDDMEGVKNDPPKQEEKPKEEKKKTNEKPSETSDSTPVPLPPSAPRNASTTVQNDFGPIGSPPNARDQGPNGKGAFSPGTSPRAVNGANLASSPNQGLLSSSPFSVPGNQQNFRPSSYSATLGLGGGVAASLGSGLAMMGGRKGWADTPESSVNAGFSDLLSAHISSSVTHHRSSGLTNSIARAEYDVSFEYDEYVGAKNLRRIPRNDTAVEDGDLEDFIPGSLTDLLTPEERNRRMSRSNSGQPATAGLGVAANALKAGEGADQTGGSGLGHRYSRSVPAPSLLGDIKSIWADTTANPLPASPRTTTMHRGTPSTSGLSARFEGLNVTGVDESGLSMSVGSPSSINNMLSPSNASAAFLPGFHSHYLSAKAKQAQQAQLGQGGLGRGLRGASGGTGFASNNSLASNYLQPLTATGLPGSPSNSTLHTHVHGNTQHTYRTTPSPFDLTQNLPSRNLNARPIPSVQGDDHLLGPHVLSPGTRALQSHAPGQSLPQGLAAGLSRIHALPPSNLISPGTPGAFMPGTSPGVSAGLSANVPYGEWQPHTPSSLSQPHPLSNNVSGIGATSATPDPTAPPKLSYSAAASRAATATPSAPPGLTRHAPASNNGGYGAQQTPRPPAHDDDDLFSMDG
ncbi:hypothetical protein CC1G_08614 [Coprinopsis cinerea okayama7|uniref:C3H1-type domain-containing protein n=1 Tax=Coprinopsis cinerea (strain Okayama-7 / 130 / ATCC MYA-4618 / FGSC 9003) TaxID=240176 RepID=A8NCZ1_COPC7|nr:hypothetical protein CC1G_08614 [Coprinopsis cinerea okayama7\|eukprot:XP_001832664.1 hypothetical protein CC1G_08614 [Coprinopsis cinerea okayama7\